MIIPGITILSHDTAERVAIFVKRVKFAFMGKRYKKNRRCVYAPFLTNNLPRYLFKLIRQLRRTLFHHGRYHLVHPHQTCTGQQAHKHP